MAKTRELCKDIRDKIVDLHKAGMATGQYPQYPIMTKQKHVLFFILENLLKIKNRNYLFTQVFRPLSMRLDIELGCILFPMIIHFYNLIGVHLW